MKIKISDRSREAQDRIRELSQELNDYNAIIMLVRALQVVEASPEKFTYPQEDYDKVIQRLKYLCAKHEILYPDGYIQWSAVEIL
jgi:uncharacterized coiled-coil DUF342 family protein